MHRQSVLCTDDKCEPSKGVCFWVNNGAACEDGSPCTGNDHCSGGKCTSGLVKTCVNGEKCTADSCDSHPRRKFAGMIQTHPLFNLLEFVRKPVWIVAFAFTTGCGNKAATPPVAAVIVGTTVDIAPTVDTTADANAAPKEVEPSEGIRAPDTQEPDSLSGFDNTTLVDAADAGPTGPDGAETAPDTAIPDAIADLPAEELADVSLEAAAQDSASDAGAGDLAFAPEAKCVGDVFAPGYDAVFSVEHCQGVACQCPPVPYPTGSACCPDCVLKCDYPNCCGYTNQWHCKYGKWQLNTWYACE